MAALTTTTTAMYLSPASLATEGLLRHAYNYSAGQIFSGGGDGSPNQESNISSSSSSGSLQQPPNASELNATFCKYHDASYGQCYVSDEHLLQEIRAFLEPSAGEWVFLGLYLACFLLGLVGNGLVVWAVVRNSHLRSTTNVLLTNLALADFLAVLVCMPPNFAQTIWETWFVGQTMCKIVEYYQVIVVVVSILTLTAISCERYCAICRPLTFKQTRTRVIVCLVVIWLAAHLAAVPRLFIMEIKHDSMVPPNLTVLLTSCVPSASLQEAALHYEIFLCVVFYALPIAVMGYTYSAVAYCLWSSAKTSILTETDCKAFMTQLQARRRTAKMLIVVVLCFIVCFLPVYTWNMIRLVKPVSLQHMHPDVVSGLTLGAHLLLQVNSCINPIIYNFMSGKFRKEFKAACYCFFRLYRSADHSPIGHEMDPLRHKHHEFSSTFHSRWTQRRGRNYDYDSGAGRTSVTEA